MNDVEVRNDKLAQPTKTMSASSMIMESQAMQEARTEIQMAKMFPRDLAEVETEMVQEFSNYSLAENAIYSYPRAKQMVTGLNIRSAEALMRAYGNMTAGFKILESDEDSTNILAVAWDKQRNVKFQREMKIQHFIVKKDKTIVRKDDPRDRLEHINSWAQRGVRAMILEVVPKGLQERARAVIESTIKKGPQNMPLNERINRLVVGFSQLGVPKEYLEKKLGRNISSMTPDDFVNFLGIFNSIKDKHATVKDHFDEDESKKEAPSMTEKAAEFNEVYEKISQISNENTKGMSITDKMSYLEDVLGVSKIEDLRRQSLEYIKKVLEELSFNHNQKAQPSKVAESEEDVLSRLRKSVK